MRNEPFFQKAQPDALDKWLLRFLAVTAVLVVLFLIPAIVVVWVFAWRMLNS